MLLAAFVLASCTPRADDSGRSETPKPGTTAIVLDPRPQTRLVTVHLEGTPHPMSARLFSAPDAGLTAPFSTYAPEDFSVSSGRDSLGEFVRFVAVFGGVRNEGAFLRVTFAPPGADSLAAVADLQRAIAGAEEASLATEHREPWTREEWVLARRQDPDAWLIGWAGLARHGERWFWVLQQYPEDYAEGIGPRIATVFREWRWEDTGEGL